LKEALLCGTPASRNGPAVLFFCPELGTETHSFPKLSGQCISQSCRLGLQR
jgi:hypothetical protein